MPRGYVTGYPASAGGKAIAVGTLTGPASYLNGTGQLFNDAPARSIDWLDGSVSVSGTYRVIAKPQSPNHPQNWYFRWIVIATGLEAANTTNLSAETFVFMGIYS